MRKWCSERCRKAQYGGTCKSCGARTDGSNGRAAAPDYCATCAVDAHRKWPAPAIAGAIREFARRYGRPPHATDFDPYEARKLGHHGRARRFERDGVYPTCTTVLKAFGTWNAAILAAGFEPIKRGGYERFGVQGGTVRAAYLTEEERSAA